MEQKILEKLDGLGRESADRRGFLKKAGKVAVTVPAVALLLSAQTTPAEAHGRYGRRRRKHCGRGGNGHPNGGPPNPPRFMRGLTGSGGGKPALRRPSRRA